MSTLEIPYTEKWNRNRDFSFNI